MRKIVLVLFVVLIFSSCKKSNEDIIKSEFKEYVKQNFDNPKDFKEIVSIEITDTITTKQTFLDAYNTILNRQKQDINSINERYKIAKKEYIKANDIEKINECKSIDSLENIYVSSIKQFKAIIDTFNFIKVYLFDISYRYYKYEDGVKILKIETKHLALNPDSKKIINDKEFEKQMMLNGDKMVELIQKNKLRIDDDFKDNIFNKKVSLLGIVLL